MKVLHVAHYAKSGIITVIKNQILCSTNPDIQYSVAVFDTIDEDLYKIGQTRNVSIFFLKSGKLSVFRSFLDYFRLIKKIAPDVVHTHSYFPRMLTGFLALFGGMKNIRAVTTIHNDYPYFYNKDGKSLLKRFTERCYLQWAQPHVICVSTYIKKIINHVYRDVHDVSVINNGISFSLKEDHSTINRGEGCIVITVGRLSSQKNYDYLLDCWSEAVNKYPESVLWFVGDGEERQSLEAKVRKLNIESSVLFMGWRNDIQSILKKADIFVLSSNYEGFPMAILEAQREGLPVVATNVSGVSDIVENGNSGFIVTKGDKAEMVTALSMLIGDQVLRLKMGKKGQLSVYSKFAIDGYIKNVESLYSEKVSY
ncbi:MAG: glycosyltransferase [Candidatus Manganitrophus sp.]|nr:glycosyltransferase [Candidatus Manganitrophus sp.]WDT79840.1 MAG: glycosyltransferase [Candidatus Manganitrophus sp.]